MVLVQGSFPGWATEGGAARTRQPSAGSALPHSRTLSAPLARKPSAAQQPAPGEPREAPPAWPEPQLLPTQSAGPSPCHSRSRSLQGGWREGSFSTPRQPRTSTPLSLPSGRRGEQRVSPHARHEGGPGPAARAHADRSAARGLPPAGPLSAGPGAAAVGPAGLLSGARALTQSEAESSYDSAHYQDDSSDCFSLVLAEGAGAAEPGCHARDSRLSAPGMHGGSQAWAGRQATAQALASSGSAARAVALSQREPSAARSRCVGGPSCGPHTAGPPPRLLGEVFGCDVAVLEDLDDLMSLAEAEAEAGARPCSGLAPHAGAPSRLALPTSPAGPSAGQAPAGPSAGAQLDSRGRGAGGAAGEGDSALAWPACSTATGTPTQPAGRGMAGEAGAGAGWAVDAQPHARRSPGVGGAGGSPSGGVPLCADLLAVHAAATHFAPPAAPLACAAVAAALGAAVAAERLAAAAAGLPSPRAGGAEAASEPLVGQGSAFFELLDRFLGDASACGAASLVGHNAARAEAASELLQGLAGGGGRGAKAGAQAGAPALRRGSGESGPHGAVPLTPPAACEAPRAGGAMGPSAFVAALLADGRVGWLAEDGAEDDTFGLEDGPAPLGGPQGDSPCAQPPPPPPPGARGGPGAHGTSPCG